MTAERLSRAAFDAAVDAAHRIGGMQAVLSVLRAKRRLTTCLDCTGDGRAAWGEPPNSLERDLQRAAELLPDLDFTRAPWVCRTCKGSGTMRAARAIVGDPLYAGLGDGHVRHRWVLQPGSTVPHAYNRNCPMGDRNHLDAKFTQVDEATVSTLGLVDRLGGGRSL